MKTKPVTRVQLLLLWAQAARALGVALPVTEGAKEAPLEGAEEGIGAFELLHKHVSQVGFQRDLPRTELASIPVETDKRRSSDYRNLCNCDTLLPDQLVNGL